MLELAETAYGLGNVLQIVAVHMEHPQSLAIKQLRGQRLQLSVER